MDKGFTFPEGHYLQEIPQEKSQGRLISQNISGNQDENTSQNTRMSNNDNSSSQESLLEKDYKMKKCTQFVWMALHPFF